MRGRKRKRGKGGGGGGEATDSTLNRSIHAAETATSITAACLDPGQVLDEGDVVVYHRPPWREPAPPPAWLLDATG